MIHLGLVIIALAAIIWGCFWLLGFILNAFSEGGAGCGCLSIIVAIVLVVIVLAIAC